ncbi:Hypothetical_protein [Hexamita inflata]|uniref:Hypothetical_protein n=1 Tax=Hexamita inflata TaxID=28002 RepID=A0AA86VFN5_9EUKA|nr:Hypothetical protein HINF_LOCUS5790 [Hexamita inflata]CAI9965398.1 Hypothetical protein HINF_LOCUS53043 [Hexamita inflata]
MFKHCAAASFQIAFEQLSKCIPQQQKQSCREIGSKFSIQYLENYDQISRQLKQPSTIKNAHDYLDHSSNGKTDMLPYLDTLDAMAYIYVEKITNNINHIYTDDDENDEYE